jgi:hypothetical protein
MKIAIASVPVDAGSVFSRLSSKRLEPTFLDGNHIRASTHTDRDELWDIIDDAEGRELSRFVELSGGLEKVVVLPARRSRSRAWPVPSSSQRKCGGRPAPSAWIRRVASINQTRPVAFPRKKQK